VSVRTSEATAIIDDRLCSRTAARRDDNNSLFAISHKERTMSLVNRILATFIMAMGAFSTPIRRQLCAADQSICCLDDVVVCRGSNSVWPRGVGDGS